MLILTDWQRSKACGDREAGLPGLLDLVTFPASCLAGLSSWVCWCRQEYRTVGGCLTICSYNSNFISLICSLDWLYIQVLQIWCAEGSKGGKVAGWRPRGTPDVREGQVQSRPPGTHGTLSTQSQAGRLQMVTASTCRGWHPCKGNLW